MKFTSKLLISSSVFAAALISNSVAGDAEVLEACTAYNETHDGDTSLCPCFAKLAEENEALKAALLAIEVPADVKSAPEIVNEAARTCGA